MHTRSSARALCVLAGLLLVSGCRGARAPSPAPAKSPAVDPVTAALEQILGWEDARTLAGGELERLAQKAPEQKVRARALRALGRLQLESTAATLMAALADSDRGPRAEAAFAVGQLGLSWKPPSPATRAALVAAVLEAEAKETDPELRLRLLEALSKLGTEPAVERLRERLSHEAPELQARAALSLGLLSKRMPGTVPLALVPALEQRLAVTGAWPLRYGAAYALSNLKRPEARTALLRCAKDPEAEIRALCAKGLRDTGMGKQVVPTLRALLSDGDFRVAVEATRSLAALADQCGTAPCPPLEALVGIQSWVTELSRARRRGAAQPLLALAQQGLLARGEPLLRELRAQLQQEARSATAPTVRDDLLRLDCRFAAALDGQAGVVRHAPGCGEGVLPLELRLIRALEQIALRAQPSQRAARVKTLAGFLGHDSLRVQLAALSSLAGLCERGETDPAVLTAVRPFLGHADPIVAANAAVIVGKLGATSDLPAVQALVKHLPTHPDLAGPLANALVALRGPSAQEELQGWLEFPHLHVRNTAALALEPLVGAPVIVTDLPAPGTLPPPAPRLEQRRLRLLTKKGAIELQLFLQDSPRTSQNLVKLAKQGLYAGTRFHRVVPDFVVQGGDPRGDGEGGPGYTLRCEVSDRPYRPGTLGMALSGKDTGGSQVFITQSPQPHLEGRYTAFGEVLSGQEVVDNLLEEDVLEGVELF